MNTHSVEEKHILKRLEDDLPETLTYHGLHHTLYVLDASMKIAKEEKLNEGEIKLLRIAVLYHDSGFMLTYKNHEHEGCELIKKDLPAFGYTKQQIDIICGIIMATKIPQSPETLLEKIICDADLDYLGRDDFYSISKSLFCEMRFYANLKDEKEWNKIQKKFLEQHHYFTSYAKKNLEPKKQQHLKEISELVSAYN